MLPAEKLSFLTEMYRWGIEVIKVIQRIENPTLTVLIKIITALGTEVFYVPLILIIFWWIDEKRGLRFGILIILSAWINAFVKDILKQPRPYNLEPSVGLAAESSYGAPSGHAQMSLTFWIYMAAWLVRSRVVKKPGAADTEQRAAGFSPERRRFLIWAGAVFMILLIGFTRLYLGVHFPTDLFAGWIIGGIILVLWFVPGPFFEKHFIAAGIRFQNILAALLALVMNSVYPRDRSLPALFLGFCLGYNLMKSRFPFSARGNINGKKPGIHVMILRCVTGFAGMVVVYTALRFILPGEGSLFKDLPMWGPFSPFYELGHFIRYVLVGSWATDGAPLLFQRMGLAPLPDAGPAGNGGGKTSSGNSSAGDTSA